MELVSKRIAKLSESQTVAMNQKTKDLQAQGVDVINLTVGEPDFATPDHIKNAAKKAIDDNYSYYSPVMGYPDLLAAISKKLKEENNLDYAPGQIIVSNGAKHSLANALLCLIDPGDEVIIPAPYWVSYAELVKLAEGVNVIISTTIEDNFKASAAAIEKAITPKTKALILCSPSNPTGAVYRKEELEAIAKVLEKHPRIFVLSDEVYEYINYIGKHESIAQFTSIKNRVVLINGVSKGFAMTGWRIGYMCGPLWLVKAANKLQSQVTTGPNSIAQKASVVAYNSDRTSSMEMVKAFRRRRDLVLNELKEIPGIKVSIPDGAFYVFPDMSAFYGKKADGMKVNNSTDMSLYLLEKAFVSTVPGDAFGEDKCIRLSYATSDEKLQKAMKQMKEALWKLK